MARLTTLLTVVCGLALAACGGKDKGGEADTLGGSPDATEVVGTDGDAGTDDVLGSDACKPQCEGRDCGDDGCGGECGSCLGENLLCNSEGKCAPCDPVGNTGCPEDQYCTYGCDESGKFVGPICDKAGTKKYGETCYGAGSCMEGLCANPTGEDTVATCHKICTKDADCGEGDQCVDLTDPLFKLCTAQAQPFPCNLLAQNCKLDTDGCYFDDTQGTTTCLTAGSNKEGEACNGQSNDCAAGAACFIYSLTCHNFCALEKGKEPTCNPDGPYPVCNSYWSPQGVGFCDKD
jgi:hypothetical protein